MVKSETCRDAEILVRNLSPRLFGKKFRDSKKVKQTMQKRDFETDQNAFEISRSYQNFSRPTFFEVPFATPTMYCMRKEKKEKEVVRKSDIYKLLLMTENCTMIFTQATCGRSGSKPLILFL